MSQPTSPVLYDWIGSGYDATRRADPYLADRLRCHLNPRPDGTYLDIACGTGNYTLALAEREVRLIGIDQSATMIVAAAAKAGPAPMVHRRRPLAASADATFHRADARWPFTTLPIWRGPFARSIACSRPARDGCCSPAHPQMRGCSTNTFPPPSPAPSGRCLTCLSCKATFRPYSGKHRPGTYLDRKVRAGISTLASSPYPGGDRGRLPSPRCRHPHRPHRPGHRLLPPPRRRLPVPDTAERLIRRRFPTSIPRPGNPRHLPLMPSPQHQQAAKRPEQRHEHVLLRVPARPPGCPENAAACCPRNTPRTATQTAHSPRDRQRTTQMHTNVSHLPGRSGSGATASRAIIARNHPLEEMAETIEVIARQAKCVPRPIPDRHLSIRPVPSHHQDDREHPAHAVDERREAKPSILASRIPPPTIAGSTSISQLNRPLGRHPDHTNTPAALTNSKPCTLADSRLVPRCSRVAIDIPRSYPARPAKPSCIRVHTILTARPSSPSPRIALAASSVPSSIRYTVSPKFTVTLTPLANAVCCTNRSLVRNR